jgi:peptidoglycan/xylan/chitin deacetylase (PgdA/CDA1 family)
MFIVNRWKMELLRRVCSRGQRNGVIVLCYHGVVEVKMDPLLDRNFHRLSDFRDHLRILRGLPVLTLDEVPEQVSVGKNLDYSAVAITFDDGYRNNCLAAELLAEARVPWTLFATTGMLGRERSIGLVEVSLLLLHGVAEEIEAFGGHYSLRTRREREAAFQRIRRLMKRLPRSKRLEAMTRLREQYPERETERLLAEFPSLQMMCWEEVSRLAAEGVEIGSHGVDHEIHHYDQPPPVRQAELTESKQALERRLGRPCRFFAFPNGETNPDSAEEVMAAGYALGFTTRQAVVKRDDNRFLLPRLEPKHSLRSLIRQL